MKMDRNILVSIGLPAYNSAERLGQVLDSLLAQTYSNFELIISDDASSDETGLISRKYQARDGRIRYVRQPHNIGRIANFLFVLRQAQGEYFMWAADDDWWNSRFLETLVSTLNANQGHQAAMSSYRRVYSDGSLKDEVLFRGADDLVRRSRYYVFKKMVAGEPLHNFFCGLWRREFLLNLFSRAVPDVLSWDRVVMAEAALAGRFISTEPVLFIKQKTIIPARKRLSKEKLRHTKSFAYLKYVFAVPARILTSPLIPIYRKPLIFFPWFWLLWSQRKRIFYVSLRDFRKIMRIYV